MAAVLPPPSKSTALTVRVDNEQYISWSSSTPSKITVLSLSPINLRGALGVGGEGIQLSAS